MAKGSDDGGKIKKKKYKGKSKKDEEESPLICSGE